MKPVPLFAVAALAAGTAFAQAPAPAATTPPVPTVTVAAHKCEKPSYPGKLAPESSIRRWSNDFRGYIDCLKVYIGERNATIEANSKAAKAAVDEFNGNVAEFNEQVKAMNQ